MRLVVTLLGLTALPLFGQSPTDHLRGRVTNDSAQGVGGAAVIVTRGPDRAIKQTTTDSAGRYVVDFENGTGDYLVAVAGTGYRTARRRVQAVQGEHDLTADFTLAREVGTLATVKVEAKKPERADDTVNPYTSETGASERWNDGVNGQMPPSLAGNLQALAGTMPGITMGAGGPSFLGASPGSNLTTLNGMALPGGTLPRAARLETRISGTTYDATRGGFAGANIDSRLSAGSRNYQERNVFATIESPRLQSTDAVGRSLGVTNRSFKASLGADGELIRRALTYNVSLDVARSASDIVSLTSATDVALSRAGVSPDSARRAMSVASALGVPVSGGGLPTVRERTSVVWLGRLDDTRDSLAARTLTTYFSSSDEGAVGLGAMTTPASASKQRSDAAGVQMQLTNYLGSWHTVLNQTRIAASRTRSTTSPYIALPSAGVLVRALQNGAIDVSSLTLGGGASHASVDERSTVESANETIWYVNGKKHRFKVLAWGRVDDAHLTSGSNALGQYSYSSLADFAANRPSSFSRTLTQPDRDGTVWNGALAFAHQWNRSRWFNLIYGARLEADGFASSPARNVALEQALGVTSGAAPMRLHLSPRLGFQWIYNRNKDNGNGATGNQLGHFYRTTAGVLRGGIGEFRDLLTPSLLADASAQTGRAGSTLFLSCVGTAVPTPDWEAFTQSASSIPNRCADGSGALGELAPAVTLISPSYDVARSWRASLDWNSSRGGWMYKLGGVLSYDLTQPSVVDANFAGTPRFTLGGADGRPVFVNLSSIDAGSGSVSAAESRRSDAFGRTMVRTSDLRGYGEQFTVSLSPDMFRRSRANSPFLGSLYGSLAYTWQRSVRQARGFDGASYGDPRVKEWAPSAGDARHIFVLQGGGYVPKFGVITFASRLQSGLPFTPIVQGDIDGDGHGGDRAFIPRASTEPDAAVAAGIRALLADGTPAAQRCLNEFAGRVAARNGCRGPWTATMNAQWQPELPKAVRRRLTASVYVQNVLGGIDQLVHGANGMRGWGMQTAPDPVLLVPRAFDAATRTFRYDVNPRFADTRPSHTLLREPFRVTIDFSLRLSTDYDLQQLRRALEPVKVNKRWERRSVDSLLAFYLDNTSNVHAMMRDQSDSLFLTSAQARVLQVLDSAYSSQVRSIYRPLAQYLSQFSDGAVTKAALDSVAAASKAYWKVFWEQPEKADSVLTPIQRDLVPFFESMLRVPKKQREQSQWQFGYEVKVEDPKRQRP
jgi:hypothetical protein